MTIRPVEPADETPVKKGAAIAESRAALAERADEIAHLWRLGAETSLLARRLAEFRGAATLHFDEELKYSREHGGDQPQRLADYTDMIGKIDRVLTDFAAGTGIHWFQMFKAVRRFLPDPAVEEIDGDLPALTSHADGQDALIAWSADLELGIKWIDRHHRALVDTLNELARLPSWCDQAETDALLERLRRTVWHHFHEEEARLSKGAEASEHVAHHRDLLAELEQLIFDVRSGRADLQMVVRGFLCDWLVEHIQTTDRRDFTR